MDVPRRLLTTHPKLDACRLLFEHGRHFHDARSIAELDGFPKREADAPPCDQHPRHVSTVMPRCARAENMLWSTGATHDCASSSVEESGIM